MDAAQPRPVLIVAFPGDHKITRRIHRHGGEFLSTGDVRVDAELGPLRSAGRVVSLCINSVSPRVGLVLPGTVPGDDEVAGRIHRDGRIGLKTGGIRIDLECSPLCCACGVVPLRIDSIIAAILSVAGPCHDIIASGIHGNHRSNLITQRVRVDPRFGSDSDCPGRQQFPRFKDFEMRDRRGPRSPVFTSDHAKS